MAFDEALAGRIRWRLARRKNVEERRMSGGVGFLLNGNLLVGVWKGSLAVRLGEEEGKEALKEPHVKEFDITGKPTRNWVLVGPEGLRRHLGLCRCDAVRADLTVLGGRDEIDGRGNSAALRRRRGAVLEPGNRPVGHGRRAAGDGAGG